MRKLLIILTFIIAFFFVVFSKSEGVYDPSKNIRQELVFWGVYDLKEVYQPVIDTFEKEHPNIRVRYRQFPNTEEYDNVLMRQLKRGEGPDIFLFPNEKKKNVIQYINPTNVKWGEGFAALAKEDLTENRLLYGLPLWLDSLMIYYNKNYFHDGIPFNWYDFAEKTRIIKAPGIAMGRLDNLNAGWDILKALMLQKGINFRLKEDKATIYDTLAFFIRFAYPIDPYFNWSEKLNKDYPDNEIDSFARRKVAAIAGYSSLMEFLRFKVGQLTDKNFRHIKLKNIGVARFPQLNTEDPKYLAKYFALGVSIHSAIPNQAWEFIRLLTNETYAEYYFQATGRIPGRILQASSEDSDLKTVQKQQVKQSSVLEVTEEVKVRIEDVVSRSLKDRTFLRDILKEEL